MRSVTTVLLGVILSVGCRMDASMARPEAVEGNEAATREVGLQRGLADQPPPAAVPIDAAARIMTVPPLRATGGAMIIRTGTASVEVDTLESAIARVRDLASRAGGYLATSDIQAIKGGIRSATLEVRVPSSRFDDLTIGLAPLGRVERVNVSAQDVGEEFTDITARAANGRRLEQRLIELIATRTGKLSDVLEIERELARVREEIERMEGRLRYLEAHAAVSSLSIQVHESGPVVGQQGSLALLAEAFRDAWRNGVRFTAAGIASLGTLVPLSLLALAGALGLRRAWRRRPA